jgi:glycine/D-amino acid oxidase-like deaminating enzyme
MSASQKIAVLGAGVLGLSIANELARAGAEVTVVSARSVQRTASLRSFSWLNSLSAWPLDYHRLRLRGIEQHRRFAASHDVQWLRFDGSLTWEARDASATLPALHDHLTAFGYNTHWLNAHEALSVEPTLAQEALIGARVLHAPDEGWIDLPAWLSVLAAESMAAGARIVDVDGEASVSTEAGRANGLRLPDGTLIRADAVVVAAGASTPEVLAKIGINIPAATNRALLVHARSATPGPRTVLRGPDVAIRTRADGALVLHAEWADDEVREDGTHRWAVDDAVVAEVLDRASASLVGRPILSLLDTGIGLRPIPGDHYSVAGAIESVPGAFVAFSHSAATLAPAIAEALAPEVLGRGRAGQLDPFRPARFDTLVGS